MKFPLSCITVLAASLLLGADPASPSLPKILPPCCRELKPAGPPTDKSLYQLDSEWTSDVGRKVKLGVLRGRPQVLAMFFTHCEYACPIILNDLQRLQKALPDGLREQVDFVLVSFDPERDTPESLRAYREKSQLGADHWTLLSGRPDDVRELAALLGINYMKDARGQFAHSNMITLLNAEGEIIRQQIGLNQEPKELVAALKQSVLEPQRNRP